MMRTVRLQGKTNTGKRRRPKQNSNQCSDDRPTFDETPSTGSLRLSPWTPTVNVAPGCPKIALGLARDAFV